MKRLRHQHRIEGVNSRLREAMAAAEEPAFLDDSPLEEALDRMRYGDCNGFGAPEARERDRRFRRRLDALA